MGTRKRISKTRRPGISVRETAQARRTPMVVAISVTGTASAIELKAASPVQPPNRPR